MKKENTIIVENRIEIKGSISREEIVRKVIK